MLGLAVAGEALLLLTRQRGQGNMYYGGCCPWRGRLSIPGVPRGAPAPGCPACSLNATRVLRWRVLGGCRCPGAMVSHGKKAMTPAFLTPADHGAPSRA